MTTTHHAEPATLRDARAMIDQHERSAMPRLRRLWSYFRNELRPALGQRSAEDGRWYRLGQEEGLPARILGHAGRAGVAVDDRLGKRREVVIENDIAWRIQTMVDFLFGKPVRLSAAGAAGEKGALIERVLDAVWEASGGVAMLQDAALLGHVYGHVDFLVRVDAEGMERALRSLPGTATEEERALCGAGFVRIEVVEAKRGIAEVSPMEYRRITRYVVHAGIRGGVREEGTLAAVRRALGLAAESAEGEVVEVVTAERTRTFVDGALVREDETPWAGGEPPVVHVQNLAQPYNYEGLSDVEALIPLQDELNTRLSDRACRVTLQSFKMYLAKGVEGVEKAGVGPGLIVSTNNPDAAIEAFGGDASSPSEERHVQEVREALDKLSGVPPLAAGVVRAKLGNLSSASALRVTLMGLLARTERKRTLYGKGLSRVSGLVLAALDHAGALRTTAGERAVRCMWQDPLPGDLLGQVVAAEGKARLGVPLQRLRAELGYERSADPGLE